MWWLVACRERTLHHLADLQECDWLLGCITTEMVYLRVSRPSIPAVAMHCGSCLVCAANCFHPTPALLSTRHPLQQVSFATCVVVHVVKTCC
jgi:hypothetical protein